MAISRRHFLVLPAAQAAAQSLPAPKPAVAPQLCLYSQVFIKVEYADLAPIIKGFGVDACDLSMQPGGHVRPDRASLDLVRAVESLRGGGVDVPVITTAFTNMEDPNARETFAICQILKLTLCKAGVWKYGAGDVMARLNEARREIAGMAALGRATDVTVALRNQAGENVGAAIWDADAALRGLDAQFIGYDFDIAQAVAACGPEGWATALRLALPRVKTVTASDVQWVKSEGRWKAAPCPLGEGMVEWPRFFSLLARGGFKGPLSLRVEYQPENEITAIQRDLDFLKKQIGAAYKA
jgi:L-ribulose-5-phosphate 3-epimerase